MMMNGPLATIYDKPPTKRTRLAWYRFVEHRLPLLVIYLLVATLVCVLLAPFSLVTVPSGYVGILWKRFGGGTVLDPRRLKSEGLRITLPWNKVFLYDLRLQSATESYNAISEDGVSLSATINTRFRLKRDAVPQLHQSIGPNYIQTLIVPEIGNRMREVISEYTAEDVYSTQTRGNPGQNPQACRIQARRENDRRWSRRGGGGKRSLPRPALRHAQSHRHAHS